MFRRASISSLDDLLATPPVSPIPAASSGAGGGAGAGAAAGAAAGAEAKAPEVTSGLDEAAVKLQIANLRHLEEPDADVQLKEFGLMALSYIIESIDDAVHDDPEAMAGAMEEIADMVAELGCEQLFEDWAPPRRAYEAVVAIDEKDVVADAADARFPATNALKDDSMYWCTPQDKARPGSEWKAKVGDEAVSATSVTVSWWQDPSNKYWLPEKFEVQISAAEESPTSASGWMTVYAYEAPRSLSKECLQHRVDLGGVSIRHVRVKSSGYCGGNPGSHRLAAVIVRTRDTAVHRSMQATLADLNSLFSSPAAFSTPAVAAHAVRGLMALMNASASLAVLLQFVRAMLKWPSDTIPDASFAYASRLMATLGPYVDESIENALSASVESMNERQGATLDPACKSSGISLSEGNMVMDSGPGSSNKCVYATQGISSGKASWVFKVVRDRNGDECLCYGCGTKPMNNVSYNSSNNLWTVRSYSGAVNNGGRSGPSTSKIHQGDEVRFELDHDAHTCELYINGASKGIVFRDLPDKELFPCIASYGSNRSARLVSVSTEANFAEGSRLLNNLEEADSSGAFAKDGKFVDGTPFRVGGQPGGRLSLSLPPTTSGGGTSVRYDLAGEPCECLVARVAVADGSASTAAPAVLEVYVDDQLEWTSPPMHEPGSTQFVRVFMGADASSVQLRTRLADGATVPDGADASDAVAKLVLVVPRIMPPRDWSWIPSGKANVRFSDLDQLRSPLALAAAVLTVAANLGSISLQSANASTDSTVVGLEVPFCAQVDADTFAIMSDILEILVARCADAPTPEGLLVLKNVLQLLRLNLQRLVRSGVAPSAVNIHLQAREGRPATLTGIHKVLDSLTDTESAFPADVQAAAAAAVDAGLTLFYPSDKERRALLSSLVKQGGTVEVQFKFPTLRVVDEEEKTAPDADLSDLRFERVLIMLQVECEAMGWRTQLEGEWGAYSHLIIEIPSTDSHTTATDFLDAGFARIFKKAGFPEWTFPSGCSEPNVSLVIQRFLNFTPADRSFKAPGVGFVRLYPGRAGSFDDVCAGVKTFLQAAQATDDDAGADATNTP